MNLSKAKSLKKLSYNIIFLFTIIICLFIALYYFMPIAFNTPVFVLRIGSNSMTPELKAGNYVLVNGWQNNFNEVVGKVVAFYDPTRGAIIVHRVLAVNGSCLITKGDNADDPDIFSPCKDYILGRVVN